MGPCRLSDAAAAALDDEGNHLSVSDVSTVEIGLKWSALAQALARGLTIVTPDVAVAAYPVATLW